MRNRRWLAWLAGVAVLAAFSLACSAGEGTASVRASATVVPTAVLVEPGYEPPEDRVASTGAFLPANGKPTLVYLEAIW